MIRFTIRRAVASQNATMWKHWSAYTAERDAWYYQLRAKLLPIADACTHVAHAVIISYRERTLDYGNLVGGAKPIPDGLKKLGYIRDDSPKWFDCEYAQEQCSKAEERTVIALSYDRELTVEEVKVSTIETTSNPKATTSTRLNPEPHEGAPTMAKEKKTRKPSSGFDREDFTKKGLQRIAKLQKELLAARETLRNKNGALKEAYSDFHQGLADGCQLDLHFGKQDEEEDEEGVDADGEPEVIDA